MWLRVTWFPWTYVKSYTRQPIALRTKMSYTTKECKYHLMEGKEYHITASKGRQQGTLFAIIQTKRVLMLVANATTDQLVTTRFVTLIRGQFECAKRQERASPLLL